MLRHLESYLGWWLDLSRSIVDRESADFKEVVWMREKDLFGLESRKSAGLIYLKD